MNEIYTIQDWERDGSFNAAPGQEVESGIYRSFRSLMPVRPLPKNKHTAKYECGFMMYEPYDNPDCKKTFFPCFGQTRDGRCYFIGYLS